MSQRAGQILRETFPWFSTLHVAGERLKKTKKIQMKKGREGGGNTDAYRLALWCNLNSKKGKKSEK